MDKLIKYFNLLKKSDRVDFLAQTGLTEGYLRKACSRKEKLNPLTCAKVEKASCGAVTRKVLRPHDYAEIWPELAKTVSLDQPSDKTTEPEEIR